MSDATKLEPPPRATVGRPIWELVIDDMRAHCHHAKPERDAIIADMEARDAFGRAKYGAPLQAHNGRDALVDAYQEALDLVAYLRQSITERSDALVWICYLRGLDSVIGIAQAIAARRK